MFDFFPLVFFFAQKRKLEGRNQTFLGWTSNPRQLKWYVFITHDLSEQLAVSDAIFWFWQVQVFWLSITFSLIFGGGIWGLGYRPS